MRVIAGIYKGRTLNTLPGLEIRPTSDRLRETLFNILAPYIVDANFLDICAGSAAVGIEALSRGASHSTFIESSRKALKIIDKNITYCEIPKEQVDILSTDAIIGLKQLTKNNCFFDIIYFDPPYQSNIYLPVLKYLGNNNLVKSNSIIIVEHHSKSPLPEIIGVLNCYRVLKQGETQLCFYKIIL